MAIHKQNNYISPEVTVVEFKMENGFVDSPFTAGKQNLDTDPPTVRYQGTENFGATTWTVDR